MTMWGSRFHRGYAMDAREEAARGLTDIEGFLYREAHMGATHRRVADFTARVEGLTPAQKRQAPGFPRVRPASAPDDGGQVTEPGPGA